MDLSWFSAGDFVVRSQCGAWGPSLPYASVVANLAIFVAYMVIPCELWRASRPGRGILRRFAVQSFVLFILSCGLGHLCQAMSFFWPAYRLFFLVDAVTAFFSVTTAVTGAALIPILVDGTGQGVGEGK